MLCYFQLKFHGYRCIRWTHVVYSIGCEEKRAKYRKLGIVYNEPTMQHSRRLEYCCFVIRLAAIFSLRCLFRISLSWPSGEARKKCNEDTEKLSKSAGRQKVRKSEREKGRAEKRRERLCLRESDPNSYPKQIAIREAAVRILVIT